MNNKQITTYFRYSSAIFGLLLALTSCAPKTDEERIAAINKRIAPEGHLTKTHLYVSWPAEYVGDRLLAKPLKLKIPIEYFTPKVSYGEKPPKIFENFEQGDFYPLSIHNHKIMSMGLTLDDGAKLHQPILVKKITPQESSKEKLQRENVISKAFALQKTYYAEIYRGTYKHYLTPTRYDHPMRLPNIAGYERYVRTECFEIDRLKLAIEKNQGSVTDLQRQLDYIGAKAKDDLSPNNCYQDRSQQYFLTSSDVPTEESVYVDCHDGLCVSEFWVQGRKGGLTLTGAIGGEGTYEYYRNKIMKSRDQNAPFKPFPQPLLGQVWTDIPEWHEKIEPTRALLNSFVIN